MGNQMQYCCVWQVTKNSWYDILWVSLSFVFKITKSINFYSNFYLLLDHSCIQLFSRVQHLDHVPLWGVQIYDMIRLRLEPQIDPSVPQPVVQSRRRPLIGPFPGWKYESLLHDCTTGCETDGWICGTIVEYYKWIFHLTCQHTPDSSLPLPCQNLNQPVLYWSVHQWPRDRREGSSETHWNIYF